jgi:rhodanese-related sulfurtransferase
MTTQSPISIDPQAAMNLLKSQPGARLIDVRTRAEFDQVHADPAHHIPMEQLGPKDLGDSGEPVLLICKSGARASNCANRLAGGVPAPLYIVEGGTEGWLRAGLPVQRGQRRVISLERQVRIAVGSGVLAFSVLALTLSPWFALGSAFMGSGLIFAGITDWCGMGLLLARMPWNK